MVSEDSDSPLLRAAVTVPEEATEAFHLLGNDIRLAILLALWELEDPFEPPQRVPFSVLVDRVGVADTGRFNYHLDQLVGRFIDRTDDGYRLRRAGYSIVQTVLAGSGLATDEVDPVSFSLDCEYCGAETVVGYRDEVLYRACTGCVGSVGRTFGGYGGVAEDVEWRGLLGWYQFDPNGIAVRRTADLEELVYRAWYHSTQTVNSGLCRSCSGVVAGGVDVCSDHEARASSVCDTCGRRYRARAIFECTTCKEPFGFKPAWATVHHPAVVTFAHERGLEIGNVHDSASLAATYALAHRATTAVLDDRVGLLRITYPVGDDAVRLTVDADLDVVAVDHRCA